MKRLRAIFAIIICKLTHAVIRLCGRGGTAFPGRLALKLCPDILDICARDVETLAITGTNGKTTSARMVEAAFKLSGLDVILNRSGANLIDGIACEFILNTDIFLKPKCRYAVIECDEAASRSVLGRLRPSVLLVTNLFRDQLDRYGDILTPRNAIAEGLRATEKTLAVLNADSQLVSSIAELCDNKSLFFGFDSGNRTKTESGETDICVFCGGKLRFEYITYANLGAFLCPSCGSKREKTMTSVCDALPDGSFVIDISGEKRLVKPSLDGIYNIYNAAGVIAALCAFGISIDCAFTAVSSFECGFGRMESFGLGRSGARMILIKNAAALDQTVEYIKGKPGSKCLAFIINNRPADGTDISWIYDIDIPRIRRLKGLTRIYVSGDRAEDMAELLKNSGITCETVPDCAILLRKLESENSVIYILPTYTAMLDTRQRLVRMLGGKNFWE